jgi:hypothetical protein
MLGHVVKRGMAHLQDVNPEYVAKLEEDSQLYANLDYGIVLIDPRAVLPVLITSTVVFVILASVSFLYTATPTC